MLTPFTNHDSLQVLKMISAAAKLNVLERGAEVEEFIEMLKNKKLFRDMRSKDPKRLFMAKELFDPSIPLFATFYAGKLPDESQWVNRDLLIALGLKSSHHVINYVRECADIVDISANQKSSHSNIPPSTTEKDSLYEETGLDKLLFSFRKKPISTKHFDPPQSFKLGALVRVFKRVNWPGRKWLPQDGNSGGDDNPPVHSHSKKYEFTSPEAVMLKDGNKGTLPDEHAHTVITGSPEKRPSQVIRAKEAAKKRWNKIKVAARLVPVLNQSKLLVFCAKGIVVAETDGKLKIEYLSDGKTLTEDFDPDNVSLDEERSPKVFAQPAAFILPASITLLRTFIEFQDMQGMQDIWKHIRLKAFVPVAGRADTIAFEHPAKIAPGINYDYSFTQCSTLPKGLMHYFKVVVKSGLDSNVDGLNQLYKKLGTCFNMGPGPAQDLYLDHIICTAEFIEKWVEFANTVEKQCEKKDESHQQEIYRDYVSTSKKVRASCLVAAAVNVSATASVVVKSTTTAITASTTTAFVIINAVLTQSYSTSTGFKCNLASTTIVSSRRSSSRNALRKTTYHENLLQHI